MLSPAAVRDEKIVADYRGGSTIRKLGPTYGLTPERVRQILNGRGVFMRHPGRLRAPRERKALRSSIQDRFFDKVTLKVEDGKTHWIWKSTIPTGYGTFTYGGRLHYAHRVGFFLVKGRWPSRLRTACQYRDCVNPDCWTEWPTPEGKIELFKNPVSKPFE